MSSMFRGLEAMFAGEKGIAAGEAVSLHQRPPDLAAKFAQIKQEILEAEPELQQPAAARGGWDQGDLDQRREQEQEEQQQRSRVLS